MMPGPLPPAIDLSAEERQALDALARRHTVPQQVAVRARIIQLAAEGLNNCQIARHLGLDVALPHDRNHFGQAVASRITTPDAWRRPSEGRKCEVNDELPSQA
jgi:hypothetical protein